MNPRFFLSLVLCLCLNSGLRADGDLQAQVETLLGNVTRAGSTARMEQTCVQKWVFDPVVVIQPEIEYQGILKDVVDSVSTITGLMIPISTDSPRPAIILVGSGPAKSGKKYKSQCSASRTVDSRCRITGATVTLPSGLDAERFRYCLTHELLHALGMQGHAWSQLSVMNPDSGVMELSAWDAELLTILYSGSISAGDREKQLRAVLSGQEN